MDATLVLHILLVIIFFLAVLACRMYCRKRNKHKSLRFIIARIHPLRVTPVLRSSPEIDQGLGSYLPGSTSSNGTEPSALPEIRGDGQDREDQISLESYTIPAETIRTADDIKSPPPPSYSAGDLPSYEEAVRWSTTKNNMENGTGTN